MYELVVGQTIAVLCIYCNNSGYGDKFIMGRSNFGEDNYSLNNGPLKCIGITRDGRLFAHDIGYYYNGTYNDYKSSVKFTTP